MVVSSISQKEVRIKGWGHFPFERAEKDEGRTDDINAINAG